MQGKVGEDEEVSLDRAKCEQIKGTTCQESELKVENARQLLGLVKHRCWRAPETACVSVYFNDSEIKENQDKSEEDPIYNGYRAVLIPNLSIKLCSRRRRHCAPEILFDHLHEALQDLNTAIKSQPCGHCSCTCRLLLEFLEALPFAAFASFLVEIGARLDNVIEEVEELGEDSLLQGIQSR
ncbi:hypothetical protein V6N11_084010 [Hibiscus sabdariffa]|uniref:Uncharacterized protein n=1 Tax=Hibiscus sabdariffa TaxID=183260 RepID=A0ABR2QD80_9ROSI